MAYTEDLKFIQLIMSIPTTKQDNLTKDLRNISPSKLAKKE